LPPEPSEDAELSEKLKYHVSVRVADYVVSSISHRMPRDRDGAEKYVRMRTLMGQKPDSYPEFEGILKEVLDEEVWLKP
jgi:hypothetical protein